MTVDMPAARRGSRRSALATYVVRVGSDRIAIRAATVWPIADVLDAVTSPAPAAGTPAETATGLMLDLIDSGMIAPPRPRRRRERPVSSRAVFYQVTRDG